MARASLLLAVWRINQRLSFLVVFLLLANLGVLVWMSSVLSPRLEALERHYLERQAEVRRQRQGGRSPQQPRNDLWSAREDLPRFWSLIPPRAEFTALIGELFTLADETGLEIDQIVYEPKPVEGRKLLRYGLSFSVAGDYGQIKWFIHSLEQSKRLMVIENVSLNGGNEADEGRVGLTLRLSTLFGDDQP